tara:strand:+ start:1005 stop:1334 length:330 start_codon:yes stop_codon:yes gene_type:complete
MAKLLPTRLPVATTEISVDLYNRLIRILEINLGEFDPSNTDQFTTTKRNNAIFNPGSIIWNTTVNSLQVWTGFGWYNIDAAPEEERGLKGTASVGTVFVQTKKGSQVYL